MLPKVIEDENRSIFYTFKEFIVGDLAFGAEGRAQVIEELRHDDEGDRLAQSSAVVGDTFGAPLKDPAGPSLHILVKLQNIMSISLLWLFVEHGLNLFTYATDQFTEEAGGVVDLPLFYLNTFSAWSESSLRG